MKLAAIGVDIGTTQTKAVGFNKAGDVLTTAYIRYSLLQTSEGMAEQKIEELFQAVVTCISKVTAVLEEYKIELISFSCAMHSLLLMSQQNQTLTRVLTWADNRAEKYAEALKATPKGQALYQATGLPMHPMAPFHKINWLKTEQPQLFYQAAKFIGIKEYIFYQFFGAYYTDYSSASGTGYFNIHEMKWETVALDYLGITEQQLPLLMAPTFQMPKISADWAAKLGIDVETIFVLGGADGPLSNLGLGAIQTGVATVTVGTSGAIRYIAAQPYLHPTGETFCFVLDEQHWVIGGATSNGTGIFDWACGNFLKQEQEQARLKQENPYAVVMEKVGAVAPGARGLLFHPYLLGERAPLWDAEATGSFVGLSRTHNEAELVRAVIEGICLNIKRIFLELEELSGSMKEIYATGGFSESPIFCQIMADVLGKPLLFTESSEASALGAVILGWQSLAPENSLVDIVQKISITAKIEPETENIAVYQQIYPLFVSTQQQLAASYHQLSKLKKFLN
jgi:gluconokinase